PTDASTSASAPNAVMSTTGRRWGAKVVLTTSSSVPTLYIGSVGSIATIARRTLAVSAVGSPAARTMKLSPNGSCRCVKNIIGSRLKPVGSLRVSPTTPTMVIHGAVGSGGPTWTRAPTALPLGQYFLASASLMMSTGGASERSTMEKTRPATSGIDSVLK